MSRIPLTLESSVFFLVDCRETDIAVTICLKALAVLRASLRAGSLAGVPMTSVLGGNLHAFRHQRARGNDSASSDLGSVQNDRADADKSAVLYYASVQHHGVPDRDAAADKAWVSHTVDMQDSVVLNAGLVADANVVHVAANRDIRPDAGSLADNDVANNLGAGINVGGVCDAWHDPAKSSNHGEGAHRSVRTDFGNRYGSKAAF